MKTPLDDPKNYNQFDPSGAYRSLTFMGQQFETAWHDSQFVNLGFEPGSLKNIVVVGMGGSNLAAHIISSLSPLLLKIPFEIVANYRLPSYVDKNSLILITSYSGNTEETLSCAQDAKQRHCHNVVITTGGKLKDFALTEHWPLVLLDNKLNPSRVPRLGLGLMLGATFGLFVRTNPEAYRFVDPKEITRIIDRGLEGLGQSLPSESNPAKALAQKNKGQSLILFSANHLDGVAKAATNFINESAKTFSASFNIPDLNHYLLEGLTFPTQLKDNTRFILLDSALYPKVIQKRFNLTKEMLIKQKYQLTVIKPEAADIVSQVFESLVFFVMFSYYLSIANHVDPGDNPWVDLFKKQLI